KPATKVVPDRLADLIRKEQKQGNRFVILDSNGRIQREITITEESGPEERLVTQRRWKQKAPSRQNNAWRYREEVGLRKVELADDAGLSEKTIMRIEMGQVMMRPETLHRYLHALNARRKELSMPELAFDEVFSEVKRKSFRSQGRSK